MSFIRARVFEKQSLFEVEKSSERTSAAKWHARAVSVRAKILGRVGVAFLFGVDQ